MHGTTLQGKPLQEHHANEVYHVKHLHYITYMYKISKAKKKRDYGKIGGT